MDSIITEFTSVTLPDRRYASNFNEILIHLNDGLGLSYSRSLGERLRKSAWRLFSRKELDLQTGHRHHTLDRCAEEKVILAIEDTTDLSYTSHKKSKNWAGRLGGPDTNQAVGANVHSSMLLTQTGIPLGIAYQRIWIPDDKNKGLRRAKIPIEDKESFKWILALRQLNSLWKDKKDSVIIKISDRESDFYELYDHPREAGVELLQRLSHKQRNIIFDNKSYSVSAVLEQLPVWGTGEIKIGRNKTAQERTASVSYYATRVTIPPPNYAGKGNLLEMNLIWVKETGASDTGVEWILLTTLSVESIEDILKCVKYYTYRWVIERFHYIIKQTLFVEDLQIDDFTRLYNVLQIYSVIAWHLLWLYRLGRSESKNPARDYFDEQSIEVLEVVTKKKIKTVDDFIKTTAQLAGFEPTKQQPNPGEKTLAQAMIRFFALYQGFMAAKQFYDTA